MLRPSGGQSRLLLGQRVGGAQWGPEWLQWGVGGKQELGKGPCMLKGCGSHCLRLRRRWARRPSATWRRSGRTTEPFARRMLGSWAGSVRPEQPPPEVYPPASGRDLECWGHWPSLCPLISIQFFLLQPWPQTLTHLTPTLIWGNHPECGSLASVYCGGHGAGVGVLDLK